MQRSILSLCDRTGNWAAPYREAGYDVVTVDMQDGGFQHVKSDIRLLNYARAPIHGILAAPPCTMFANSGARWPRTPEEILNALSIVDACMRMVALYRPQWWALENPVGKLNRWLGAPSMYFDPCDYGDPYTKKTGLWGQFTHPPKNRVEPTEGSKLWRLPPGPERANLRSATPMGFARAFFASNP